MILRWQATGENDAGYEKIIVIYLISIVGIFLQSGHYLRQPNLLTRLMKAINLEVCLKSQTNR
jgi:hypothetical protein